MHGFGLHLHPGYTSPAHRQEHPVRGKVLRHIHRTTGFWIFKTTYPGFEIQLDQDALQKLEQKGLTYDNGGRIGLSNPINIFVDEKDKLKHYPEGARVTVVFGYAGPTLQFYRGQAAMMIMRVDPEIAPQD